MVKKKETDYYPEISEFVVGELKANMAVPEKFHIFAIMGELRKNLLLHVKETNIGGAALQEYAEGLADLQTDIAILVLNTETSFFDLLILEVKLQNTVGLTQLSQLVGYCLVSGARLGLLVNVGGGSSTGLKNKLTRDPDLSRIKRVVSDGQLDHKLGLMYWNPETQRLEYSNLGAVRSIPEIAAGLESELSL